MGESVAGAIEAGSFIRAFVLIIALPLALPVGYRLAPAVVVTQTLVELTGTVGLTRIVPTWLVPDAPRPILGRAVDE